MTSNCVLSCRSLSHFELACIYWPFMFLLSSDFFPPVLLVCLHFNCDCVLSGCFHLGHPISTHKISHFEAFQSSVFWIRDNQSLYSFYHWLKILSIAVYHYLNTVLHFS